MGDEQFQLGSGSWWDTTRNRPFDNGTTTTTPASISTTLNTIASFGSAASSADGGLDDQNLQMMGLGLSSQNLDWNQALLGEKVEGGFRSLLQEDFPQKLYSAGPSEEDSFKQINRPIFSLDQATTAASGFHVDFDAMLLSENRPSMNYQFPSAVGGGAYGASEYIPTANKYLQFTRTSRPPSDNNAPFWNASTPEAPRIANHPHPRSSFFPTGLRTHQIPPHPSFDEKAKKSDSNAKKNSSEASSNKRPRGNETHNPMPAFKARKEKMGDRITALQQLVSPFGKTDTASVLTEAIAYIKFLHEQVSVLSNPYMKNGAPVQHQQMNTEGSRQDLRSRGLCLVPVSSTFPMTHETSVDFWTPTFGGTFR